VAYLVRSFQTNARIRSLTTGTFNRVVKDRIAIRLSGANSVQANPHKCESDCPRNLTNIRCRARPCQRKRPTEFPRDFHNGNSGRRSRSQLNQKPKSRQTLWFVIPNRRSRRGICFCLPGAQTRATVWPSASKALISAHAEAEDRKLRKDLAFGGPCLEGTLQKPTRCFRIKPRGRGD
jgi:hypothetical protein